MRIRAGLAYDCTYDVCQISCTLVSLSVSFLLRQKLADNEVRLPRKLAPDILMALAIKHMHNLPPHVSYVSTLPDVTQKLKRYIDELKH